MRGRDSIEQIMNDEETARFRWRNDSGSYVDYDPGGAMLGYGRQIGGEERVEVTPVYGGGRLTGVRDSAGRQVLWYRYEGDDLEAVWTAPGPDDSSSRRVRYDYDTVDGRRQLEAVRTYPGPEDTEVYVQEYDYRTSYPEGALEKKRDITGEATIEYDLSTGYVKRVVDRLGRGHQFRYEVIREANPVLISAIHSLLRRSEWTHHAYDRLCRPDRAARLYPGATDENEHTALKIVDPLQIAARRINGFKRTAP